MTDVERERSKCISKYDRIVDLQQTFARFQVTTLLQVVKHRSPATCNLPLTVTDVERERGKPLSKYDRNMMIFNWLHTLDETSVEGQ